MKKIIVMILVTLLYLSCITITNINSTAKASSEEDNYLDTQYIYNITKDLSDIINDPSIYPPGTIAKGRAFGTEGEHYAAKYIIKDAMENDIGLYNPCTGPELYLEQIENINYPHKIIVYNNLNLTDKLEVLSKRLTIHENNNTFDVECFISPTWNDTGPFDNRNVLTR